MFSSQLMSEDDGDLIFSPISIYIALVLTYVGAEGKTAEELKKYLHLPGSKDEVLKGVRLLLDQLKVGIPLKHT